MTDLKIENKIANADRGKLNASAYKIEWERKYSYIIEEKIGGGSFSEVYKCRSKADLKQYALKMMKEFVKVDDIRREAQVLETLRGAPNIIQLHGRVEKGPVSKYLNCRSMKAF